MANLSTTMTSTFSDTQREALNRKRLQTRFAATALAILILLVVWYWVAMFNRPWVPSITDTIMAMGSALTSAQFYSDLAATWERLLLSFVTATLLGFVIGSLMGFNRSAEYFAAPLVAIALAVPDPVYVIFSSLALNTGELAGFVALTLAVMPFVINVVHAGIGARDRDLDEMTKIYRITGSRNFRHSIIPQLVPSLLTATRFSFALSWKVVILVEALTDPNGVGARIYEHFHLLRMKDAIAQAIIFCLLMQVVEWVVFLPIERRLLRWRR